MSLKSVADSARRALAKKQIYAKARKGDLVVIEVTHSAHSIKLKREAYTTYELAEVASVKRNGAVTTAKRPDGMALPRSFTRVDIANAPSLAIVPQERLGMPAGAFLTKLPEQSFSTLDAARDAIRKALEGGDA